MTPTRAGNAPQALVTSQAAHSNGVTVDRVNLDAILHAVDEFRGNRRRARTLSVLEDMRSKGFNPEAGDWCIINADFAPAFNDHPCFRWSPYVKDMVYLSRRLLGFQVMPSGVAAPALRIPYRR